MLIRLAGAGFHEHITYFKLIGTFPAGCRTCSACVITAMLQ